MFYPDLCQMISLAKVLNATMGTTYLQNVSMNDVDIASEILKNMADNSPYWTQEQKDTYKLMVDYTKERTKRNLYV